MSGELFGRRGVITFGVRGQPGKRIEGLRIKFKIEKDNAKYPNKASISVYNLNSDSRALVERKGLALILSVGYQDQLKDIFNGDIARPTTKLEGTDYVTTFEVGDGEVAFQSARVDITYNEGTSFKDVFVSMAQEMGKTIKDLSALGPEKILNGLSLSGPVHKNMDDVTGKLGLQWSIQDDAIQILKKGGNTKDLAILLTPQTGLIGIPIKKDEGVELTSLLQAEINPGRLIQVESKFLKGVYRVDKVTHEGDTLEGPWFSKAECKPQGVV